MDILEDNGILRRNPVETFSSKIKKTLLVICYILWIIGGLLAAVGGWSLSQIARHVILTYSSVPGAVLITAGFMIFIASSLGVLGTKRENLFHLKIYRISLICVLIVELISGLIAFAFWSEVKKIIHSNIGNGIKHYSEQGELAVMLDELQRDFQCCGSLSYDDWDSNPYFKCRNVGSYRSCGVPWSCCLDRYGENRQCGYGARKDRVNANTKIHTIGCLDMLFELTKTKMQVIGGLAIGCNIPLLIGIYLSHRLTKHINRLIAFHYIDHGKIHY